MYRLAISILKNTADAEDAVSEAILIAYENLASLKDTDRFLSWMMTIVANSSKKLLRTRKKVDLYADTDLLEQSTQEGGNEIWDTVLTLPKEYGQVVVLYYYEGFSTKEIAGILHIPEGTVKSRLSRARHKLQQLIGN